MKAAVTTRTTKRACEGALPVERPPHVSQCAPMPDNEKRPPKRALTRHGEDLQAVLNRAARRLLHERMRDDDDATVSATRSDDRGGDGALDDGALLIEGEVVPPGECRDRHVRRDEAK